MFGRLRGYAGCGPAGARARSTPCVRRAVTREAIVAAFDQSGRAFCRSMGRQQLGAVRLHSCQPSAARQAGGLSVAVRIWPLTIGAIKAAAIYEEALVAGSVRIGLDAADYGRLTTVAVGRVGARKSTARPSSWCGAVDRFEVDAGRGQGDWRFQWTGPASPPGVPDRSAAEAGRPMK
jgi:hypothetical protein